MTRAIAEWARHRATWVAWPCGSELWGQSLVGVQEEFVGLCRAIAGEGGQGGEQLEVLVHDASAESVARERLSGLGARLHRVPYGDIWLRDTAPVFVAAAEGLRAAAPRFNGWGRKYQFPDDDRVAERVAELAAAPYVPLAWVGEGGAMDFDGAGLCMASSSCLLSPMRNPDLAPLDIERSLAEHFGVEHTIWISPILDGDHTDGHVDTLARFVAPGVVVCSEARSPDDPSAPILRRVLDELRAARAAGAGIEIEVVVSPGPVLDAAGALMPASYMNFYVANAGVVVPCYGTAYDVAAVEQIARLFPDRRVIGRPARHILEGGGAFHCITQQEPANENP
jgi:agmatine deiminase